MRKLLCLLFFFCAFLRFIAIPLNAADKWISAQTKNFLLIGNGSDNDLRRAGHHLEELRAAYTGLFPKAPATATVSTVVFVFKNDDSFKPYKPLVDGKPANLSGFFQPGTDVHYMAVTGSLANQSSVLHDYIHAITHETIGTLPFWVSEGLAEYFSTFEAGGRDGEFTIGRTPTRHTRTLTENFLPFDRLIAIDHTSSEYNERTKQGAFYAQTWGLIHYLSLGAEGKRQAQLLKFLSLLSQEHPVGESFSSAFQTDGPTLEKELRDYVRGRTLPSARITAKGATLVDRATSVSTLSDAEAQYRLGDLLLHSDRFPEAETHLKAALSLDPKLGRAYASLGMVNLRTKKYTEAVTYTKKGVETDERNYLTNYYYGYLLQTVTKSGETVATVDEGGRYEATRSHFHKAIDLAPNFVEAYGALAQVNMDEGENLKEAEVVLRKALTIAPGRHDLAIQLAEAMLRTDQTPAARGLLTTLGKVSTDPSVRSRALNLIEQLDLRDTFYKELTGSNQALPPQQTAAASPRPPAPATPAPAAPSATPAPLVTSRKDPVLESLTPPDPAVEGERITGLLTLLDCTNGLTLRVQVGNRVIELHSSRPENIQFVSFTSSVADSIKCGPRNPATPVKITYRAVTGGTPASVGEPLVVEFLEK